MVSKPARQTNQYLSTRASKDVRTQAGVYNKHVSTQACQAPKHTSLFILVSAFHVLISGNIEAATKNLLNNLNEGE